jgi:E3 ubiquitin-protein ligase DOA10
MVVYFYNYIVIKKLIFAINIVIILIENYLIMVHNCRICFEDDVRKNLISPCLCSGNSKYVHPNCLEDWRNMNLQNTKYYFCEICKENYIFEFENTNFDILLVRHKIFLTLELFIYILISLITIYSCGMLVKKIIDNETHFSDNRYIDNLLTGTLFILIVTFIIGYTCVIYINYNRFFHNEIHHTVLTINNKSFLLLFATIGIFIILYFIIKYTINIRKKYLFDKYYLNVLKTIVKDRDINY